MSKTVFCIFAFFILLQYSLTKAQDSAKDAYVADFKERIEAQIQENKLTCENYQEYCNRKIHTNTTFDLICPLTYKAVLCDKLDYEDVIKNTLQKIIDSPLKKND